MKEFIKKFNNHNAYTAFTLTEDFVKPNVSLCVNENEVHYNPWTWAEDYLTFVALEDGTFTFSMNQKLTTEAVPSVSYSTDNGETWTTVQNIDNEAVTVTTPTISTGNKVLWKSNAVQYYINPDSYPGGNVGQGRFSSTGTYNVEGNIMSLMYGDDFKGKTSFKTPVSSGYGAGAFSNLFKINRKIISVEHLVLPATTLADYCYSSMFQDCTSLTTAPELPATTLAYGCYREMFRGCTSLTSAPELPATTLASYCYYGMFQNCTSLTTAPVLPATTLADYCYQSMFKGCTNLVTAPELPATTLANYCYYGMFQDCTSLTTAPELPATTLAQSCYGGMFVSCSSLTSAPELPATTLADNCYGSMFNGCTRLNYIKAMFTTTPTTTYTNIWVDRVAATGTFVKNSAATWNVTGVNGIPTGWTVQTASE